MADDEVVKRHGKAHHKARNNAGNHLGQFYHKEGAGGGASQILGRLGQGFVHLLEAGKDRQHDVGQVEGDVGDEQGTEAEKLAGAQKGGHRHEEKHHGNTCDDIGVHHGDVGQGQNGLLDEAMPHTVKTQGGEGAQHGGDEGRADRQHQGVSQSREGLLVVEQLLIPNKGEARKFGQAPRLVEGEDDKHHDGDVEQEENQTDIEFGQELHSLLPPSSSSENLFMMATEMMMRIIMMRDMAAPTL